MPITVIVRSRAGDEPSLTFDGAQRVVIGRGAGSDVRVPDATVSHRHASLRSQGGEFIVVDEGSSNGTFVGGVRVAARMSRIVRSGDWIRVGRVWLRLVVDQSPATRDLAMATRDLALAFVAQVMQSRGIDRTTIVRVVEGPDQGATLALAETGRGYVVGRGPECDLALADADASREHLRITRTAGAVLVQDLGAKNGSWLGGASLASEAPTAWRTAQMLQVGRSVLALAEPVADILAEIEEAEDEPVGSDEANAASPDLPAVPSPVVSGPATSGLATGASASPVYSKGKRLGLVGTWSLVDLVVMGAALAVLALSLVGIFWLLRGVSAAPSR